MVRVKLITLGEEVLGKAEIQAAKVSDLLLGDSSDTEIIALL